MKKKKESFADFRRRWGLPAFFSSPKHLRYRQPLEKGAYWYWFSLYIRQRDVQKYGTCISCKKPITVETAQAGHFMPAVNCGRDLLFDERNVNAECAACNGFDETHLLGYAEGLDARYGAGTASELRKRRDECRALPKPPKDHNSEVYSQKIEAIKLSTQLLDNPSAWV